jgi:hypothetical protein
MYTCIYVYYYIVVAGKGTPNQLAANCQTAQVTPAQFPERVDACDLYRLHAGSQLKMWSFFAICPFPSEDIQVQCEASINQRQYDVAAIYSSVVNNRHEELQTALQDLIGLVSHYCS